MIQFRAKFARSGRVSHSLLLIPALVLAAVSLLTVVRAPGWMWAWKLTILVGEFGHWLALLALVLGWRAWVEPAGPVRDLTLVLAALAFACLLRPVFRARRVGERLPAEIAAAFGGGAGPGPAVDLRRLFRQRAPAPAAVLTEVFARPDGQELKIDFYAPPLARDPARRPPCLVVIHGGGWDGGDRKQLAAWNSRWAARGYAVAAISYRLAPRWIWPAQRDDVLAAIAWL